MPIDCIDFRKIREDRIEHIWNIVQAKDGKEPDNLELFIVTHKPKRPETKLDNASTVALVCHLLSILFELLDEIRTKLDGLPESSRSNKAVGDKIYEEIIGEDKNGYAKTYGLGQSQLRRGEYGSIEGEEAYRSFWQEFEKDSPSYKNGSPVGEDEFVSDDEDA
ncbi:hypothetical protein Cgig2_012678 [Carnegiea gigantea]|uniref:Uncharacterized protein n=1 Tax=Carnegiea gigantea TaxID=171969 RepID=A0A9Q1JZH5_9CARY|nr:hypothetical protein Cgig2_012678 [Carnegiea gigantea]